MDELGFEDKEILLQVMGQAMEEFTHRQLVCLLLQLAGWNQEEVGRILGIAQPVVCQHFNAALGKVRKSSLEYL